jgi:GT2 family glycosyltransferase
VTAVVIPSLGGLHLAHCLDAVGALDPAPTTTVVVVSGGASAPVVPAHVRLVATDDRLGFAAAVNTGISHCGAGETHIALLNDDAFPSPGWLGTLERALDDDPDLASVQGTVTDAVGATVDGRGIALDGVGLPVQIDRGGSPAPEQATPRRILAVSGTASLYRSDALRAVALSDGAVFDPAFGSYHEDLDLGLRLLRLGWKSAWVPGAWAAHIGSATGRRLGWRHPWWILANRWRALAGNLSSSALLTSLPRLLRGELRAVHTLTRDNPRALPTAAALLVALPWIVTRSMARPSHGPRLDRLPEADL